MFSAQKRPQQVLLQRLVGRMTSVIRLPVLDVMDGRIQVELPENWRDSPYLPARIWIDRSDPMILSWM